MMVDDMNDITTLDELVSPPTPKAPSSSGLVHTW
jgi:hypothetical protein